MVFFLPFLVLLMFFMCVRTHQEASQFFFFTICEKNYGLDVHYSETGEGGGGGGGPILSNISVQFKRFFIINPHIQNTNKG